MDSQFYAGYRYICSVTSIFFALFCFGNHSLINFTQKEGDYVQRSYCGREVCIREGLRDLVEWHKLGFSLVGAFEDGDELISLLERQPPDLLVTDIRMNRCSGLEVAKYIQEHNLRTRVILISGYKEADLAMSAIRYGVKNYVLKPVDLDELTECIQRPHRIGYRTGRLS